MPTRSAAEVAADKFLLCDWPDDGSGHTCPKVPRTRFELMAIEHNGRTHNCCYDCWLHKIHTEEKTLQHFATVGGYDIASDPPMVQTLKIFRLLCQRIDMSNALRIAFDPKASLKTVEKTASREHKRLTQEIDKNSIGGKILRI